MKKRLRFYLNTVPYIGVAIFFIFNSLAILFYPGYEKCVSQEKDVSSGRIICSKSSYIVSDTYSFSQNFFSELGSINTNTDDDHLEPPNLNNNKSNTISMILFNGSLICVGIVLLVFYANFYKLFKYKEDSSKSRKISKFCMYLGVITGAMFAGVGLVPHDLHFGFHVFFANWAFTSLLPLSMLHALSFKYSNHISSAYASGYAIFCCVLLSYVYLIFWGPAIGPEAVFTKNDLTLQVVAQKIIVLIFIMSMIHQTQGIRKSL